MNDAYEGFTGADGSLHKLGADGSLHSLIDAVTVLNDIKERLEKITQAQIDAAGRKLRGDEKGALIGVIGMVSTRALWTLFMSLEGDSELHTARAKLETDEHEETEHRQQAAILDMFRDCVRELFWAQAKLDLGFYEGASVGLRKGWELHRTTGDPRQGFLAALAGGGFPPLPPL